MLIPYYLKVESDIKMDKLRRDFSLGVNGTISPTMSASTLNSLPDGLYLSERSGQFNFPNQVIIGVIDGVTIPNNTVPTGYDIKFYKEGTTWRMASGIRVPAYNDEPIKDRLVILEQSSSSQNDKLTTLELALAGKLDANSMDSVINAINQRISEVIYDVGILDLNKASVKSLDDLREEILGELATKASNGNIADLDSSIEEVLTEITAIKKSISELTKVVSNNKSELEIELVKLDESIDTKVDKVNGKSLSTNDFTNTHKTKVEKLVTSGVGKLFLADDGTYKKAGSGSGSGLYNVTTKFPLANGYHTLDTAILLVVTDEDLEDFVGMVITIETEPKVWVNYRFTGTNKSDLTNAENWVEDSVRNVVKSIDLYKGVDKSTLVPDANGNIVLEIPITTVDETLTEGGTNPVQGGAIYAELSSLNTRFGSSLILNTIADGVYSLSMLNEFGEVISTTETFSGGGGGGNGEVISTKATLTKISENPTIKLGDEVSLKYIYDQIDTTSNSSTGNSATATITITRGATSNTITKTIGAGATDTIDVTEYLAVGTSTVRVRVVTNDEFMQVATISWQVNVIQLKLESSYNIATKFTRGDSVSIPYSLTGSGSKTLKLYVDGVLKEDKVITTSSSSGTFTYSTSSMSHGTHSFQLVATLEVNEDITITSNSIYFGVVVVETARTAPVIGIRVEYLDGDIITALNPLYIPIKQYETYEIIYAVYNPTASNTQTTITIGGEVVSTGNIAFVRTSITSRSTQSGTIPAIITAGSTKLEFNLEVAGLNIDVSEPTDGLSLRLLASNRTNSDVNKTQWESMGVTSELSGFTWVGNGWLNGALRHTDNAKTVIKVKPLTQEYATNNVITLEFKFKVSNLISTTEQLIKCVDSQGVGFVITGQEARMVTRGGSEVSTKFATDEEYSIAFVSFPNANSDATEYEKIHSNMLYLYINGILSGGVKRGDSDTIYQVTPMNIEIGTRSMAILDIYSVKLFKKSLTDSEMLNSYLTSISNTDLLLDKFLENNILDQNGNISVESLPKELPYMIITGAQENGVPTILQAANNNNKDTKYNVDEILFVNPSKPSKNFKVTGGMIRLQGTSSLAYPIKNYRIYFYDTSKVRGELRLGVDSQGNGGTVKADSKYSFKDATANQKQAIPVDCFCLKADYAESSSSHNTGTAVIVHDALQYANDLTPAQKNASKDYQYDVRTTIDGFPMVLFYRATKNDTPVFLSKFNFNNDKSTEDVFGFKSIPGYHDQSWVQNKFGGINPTECWEFLNNDYPMGMFLDADFDSRGTDGLPNWTKVFEARFIHDEALVEDYESGTTKPAKLEALVKWVNSTANNPTKFKNELANYFDVKHLCDYYMITDMLGAVDQRVKNMMMAFWYNPEVDKTLAYMIFYDNDTILGVRNDGKLKYDWTIDEETKDPELSTSSRPVYAFAGHDSVLWKNLRGQFATELGDAYKRLRAKLTNDYLFSIYDTAQSSKFSERLYNLDAINKYIIPATKGVEVVQNGQTTYQVYDYLEAMQGSRYSHRHYWLINRLNFLDAKYNTGAYRSTDINWKGNTATGAKVSAVASKDYYFAFTRESAVLAHTFIKEGGTFTHTYNQEANIGTIFHLYGGDWMKKLDLSNWGGFTSLSLPKLRVLEELVLGNATKTYTLPSLAIGDSLPLLKKIDITNYTNLTLLDLGKCPSIEEVIASGCTSLSNINLYGGAPLTKLVLPSNYKNLAIAGLPKLTNAGLIFEDITKIESISITDCPNIDTISLLNRVMSMGASQKIYIRLSINNLEGDGTLLKQLDQGNYGGVTAGGSQTDSTINLIGTYTLTSWLDEGVLEAYRTKFPELTIKQVPYTMISYPTDVADPQKLTNLDNNTGYGTGKAYEVSGHIKKILDLREYVMVKKNGTKGVVYCQMSKKGERKFKDGLNTAPNNYTAYLCVHEPKYFFKGVNDFINKKNYILWAWTEDGLPPPTPKVTIYNREYINRFKISDTLINPKATDISSVKVSNILYDSYKIEIPNGSKKIRVQLPISNSEPPIGLVFTSDSNLISTYEPIDPELLMTIGMYTVLDIPTGSKYVEYCLPKSFSTDIKLLFSYSEKIEDIEDVWVESKEKFVSAYPNVVSGPSSGMNQLGSYSENTTRADATEHVPYSWPDSLNGFMDTSKIASIRYGGRESHFDYVKTGTIMNIFNLAICKYGTFNLGTLYTNNNKNITVTENSAIYGIISPLIYPFEDQETLINPGDPDGIYLYDRSTNTYNKERYVRLLGYCGYFGDVPKDTVNRYKASSRISPNKYLNFPYSSISSSKGWSKVVINETYVNLLPVNRSNNQAKNTYTHTYAELPVDSGSAVQLAYNTLDSVGFKVVGPYGTGPKFLTEWEDEMVLISNSDEFLNFPADSTRYRYSYDDTTI